MNFETTLFKITAKLNNKNMFYLFHTIRACSLPKLVNLKRPDPFHSQIYLLTKENITIKCTRFKIANE